MVILISVLAFIATILGGLFALHFKDKLHLILGFSAGAVIAVAFFDLIPEAINLSIEKYEVAIITSVVALGFVIYMILDRFVFFHTHYSDEQNEHVKNNNEKRGSFGAGSLSFHSFLDGVAIGLAFQVSTAVGIIITTAILIHDFSDGINTVSLILKNGGKKNKAFQWLIIDAIAPILGVISTLFFTLPQSILGIILALFAGFFLYIGASDLLPESHHNHPTKWTTFATIFGIAVLYIAINMASM